MYASVRRYLDVPAEAMVEVGRRGTDMTAVIGNVPGLTSYQLVVSGDGVFVMMVCRDEQSAIEANRRSAAWLQAHIPGFGTEAPEVWAGPVTVSIDSGDHVTDRTNGPAKGGAKR